MSYPKHDAAHMFRSGRTGNARPWLGFASSLAELVGGGEGPRSASYGLSESAQKSIDAQRSAENANDGTAPISGWPSAPPHRPAAWDGAEYMIHSGDTLSGLAARYLGDPARFLEIWRLQTGNGSSVDGSRQYVDRYYHKIDPSSKNPGPLPRPGMFLIMPKEAQLRAEQFTASGQGVPAAPSAPGNRPGAGTTTTTTTKTAAKAGAGLAIGAAAAAALYFATR